MFEERFINSKGKPIEYKGKTIYMIDYFDVPIGKSKIRVEFISTDSDWKQGIELQINGNLIVNNQKLSKGTRLWKDSAPKSAKIELNSKDGKLMVMNIWDHGDGITQKWHNGGAMYFEETKNGKIYYCNDGHPNDDFNDLIFNIERI